MMQIQHTMQCKPHFLRVKHLFRQKVRSQQKKHMTLLILCFVQLRAIPYQMSTSLFLNVVFGIRYRVISKRLHLTSI